MTSKYWWEQHKWYTNCFWAYRCSRQQGLFWQVTSTRCQNLQLASSWCPLCLCDVRVVNADNASTCSTAAHAMQESNASCQMMTSTPYHVLMNRAPQHIFVNHMIRSRLIASYGALVVNTPCDKLGPNCLCKVSKASFVILRDTTSNKLKFWVGKQCFNSYQPLQPVSCPYSLNGPSF